MERVFDNVDPHLHETVIQFAQGGAALRRCPHEESHVGFIHGLGLAQGFDNLISDLR